MNQTVATTIHQQIGGQRFIVMTGSKIILCKNDGIIYKLAKNKTMANELKITLNGNDLYDLEFSKHAYPTLNKKTWEWQPEKKKVVMEYKNIYCDQLEEIFTETTGMTTRLF